MPVGIDKSSAGLGGNIPQQNIVGYTRLRQKQLYYSQRDIALIFDKTLRGGYGAIELGTVLAQDQNTDKFVPYVPDSIDLDKDVGRVPLLNDCDTADNFDVLMEQSYKLSSGDTIVLTDSDGTYEQATISDIDRDSYDYKATVTLSGAVSGTFTTAKKANCYLQAQDVSGDNKASKAVFILDMNVDTGNDEYAAGALAPVLISNAIIYQAACVGMDSQAITDLGNVTSDGQFYILK